jgi:dTDP-glucose pyrophosphorylase
MTRSRRKPLTDYLVREGTSIREVLTLLSRTGTQLALVVDGDRRLVGIATDGDLRRAIVRDIPLEGKVDDAMNRTPQTATPGTTHAEALALMRGRSLWHLPVVGADGVVVDVLALAELLAQPEPLATCAVIMAGGEGKRLRPLTDTTPKPLLSVGGRPLLEILIERLRQSGLVDLVLAVHHKSAMIRDRLGDGARLGVSIAYVEEDRPLGTMGALTLVRDRIQAPFLVVNSDILTKCDFRAMWEFHRAQAGAGMTVGVSVHQVEIPYGEFTLHGDRVLRVEEKPRKEFPINAGIYVVEPKAVDLIPRDTYFDATDLIRTLLEREQAVAAYLIREYWLDVGRHPDLERANEAVAQGLLD